ncbi:MAG: response regulator, partial [Gammaproteobacteria bacterium]|nr:response regulator [Gammaproteobacteria bacterium]
MLIVDDEPINLDIICAHLEDENYELVRATNGEEAWSRLEADPTRYDTVILDR